LNRTNQLLIKGVVITASFNRSTRLDDIALIHAPGIGAHLMGEQPQLSLAIEDLPKGVLDHSHTVTLVGWGTTKHMASKILDQVPDLLQTTPLGFYDLEQCRKRFFLLLYNTGNTRKCHLSKQAALRKVRKGIFECRM